MKIALCSKNPEYFLQKIKELAPQTYDFSSLGNSKEIIITSGDQIMIITCFNNLVFNQSSFDQVIVDNNIYE